MVYPTGPRTRARVARDAWSTPRSLGYTHNMPGTAVPLRRPSGTGSSRPGRLLETAAPPNRARVAQDHWSTTGPWTLTGVTWDSWSTPQALRPGPETRRTAGRPRGLSDLGTRCRGCWSTPRDFGLECESPGIAGRPCRTLDQSASGPGFLVEPARPSALARVAQDRRSTSRDLRHEPESSGTAGQPRGPSDPSACHAGMLVHTPGLGHSPESPRKAGRHRRPLGMGPSHRGRLVHPTGYRT